MKKLILIIAIVFSGMLMQGQTDLDIINKLIGKPFADFEQIMNEEGFDFYIVNSEPGTITFYVQRETSIRKFKIAHKDVYRKTDYNGERVSVLAGADIITGIFIRYRHSNMNDLKEFFEFDIPEDTKFKKYEKSLGKDISHFSVTQG